MHKRMLAGYIGSVLLVLCGGCSSPSDKPTGPSTGSDGRQLPFIGNAGDPRGAVRINEVGVRSTESTGAGAGPGWIEIVNVADYSLALDGVTINIDGAAFQLPTSTLKASETLLVGDLMRVDGSVDGFVVSAGSSVRVIAKNGNEVDSIVLPLTSNDQSVARSPHGSGEFVVYDELDATPGTQNIDRGFVNRVASATEFSPRDSSPNAMLQYGGRYWVFGGWSNVAHDVWQSSTEVWTSRDAVRWELVDPAPPFIHYCSFVSWAGRMWVVGPKSFSSTDGRNWRSEALEAPALNRSIVHDGRLISISRATVRATADGENWTVLTDSAPWGERDQPAVLGYRGRIWVIGGVTGYGTPQMTLHRDVWSSADGVQWHQVTPSAAWSARHWMSAVVYDDRMFLMNGWNPSSWPEGNGNTSEIWISDDGETWLPLPSERRWTARHAAFATANQTDGIVLAAGYGSGGTPTIYNDVWRLRASLFFPKANGPLDAVATWGKNSDGSGEAPDSFDRPNQVFVLRNRSDFQAPATWRVSGGQSVIVVGVSDPAEKVTLDVTRVNAPLAPIYLSDDATLVTRPGVADVRIRGARSQIVFVNTAP